MDMMNKVIEIDLNKDYPEYKPEKVYMLRRPDGTRIFDGEFYCKNVMTAIRRFCKLVPECQYIYDEAKEYGAFSSDSPFAPEGFDMLPKQHDGCSIYVMEESYYIAAIIYPSYDE